MGELLRQVFERDETERCVEIPVPAWTLILEFLDGSTGEVLARVAERRRIDTIGGRTGMATMPTNTVTVRGDVKRWAASTAKRLRNELDLAVSGH